MGRTLEVNEPMNRALEGMGAAMPSRRHQQLRPSAL